MSNVYATVYVDYLRYWLIFRCSLNPAVGISDSLSQKEHSLTLFSINDRRHTLKLRLRYQNDSIGNLYIYIHTIT